MKMISKIKSILNRDLKLEFYVTTFIIVLYFIVGFLVHKFIAFILIKAMILSIFALGYSLLFSKTGLLSFGHAAFFAVGAYASGLFILHIGNSMVLSFFVASIVVIIVSTIIGLLCLIRTKIYFAMLTLAFGMGIYTIIWEWTSLTGGDNGLLGINRTFVRIPLLGSVSMLPIAHYYFFVLFFLILSIFIIYFLSYSSFGIVLKGIRQNETRIKYSGFSPKLFTLIAFIISGFFAGLAGFLDVFLENNASPDMAYWGASAIPIFAVLLGGIESFSGPIIGATILTFMISTLQIVSENWKLWYGLTFIVIIIGFRGGIMGFLKNHVF